MAALGATVTQSSSLIKGSARATTPKKGGRLRIGSPGAQTSDSLDTATITNLVPETLSWQIRNCLVEIDYRSEAIPELAESWESTPDATKWIFKLRKGVEFHNGKTFEAQDAIFIHAPVR
jgi:peptide/nickel transport system substrate-binding protein